MRSLPFPHAESPADAVAAFETDAERGLSLADAERRLGEYGPNELPRAVEPSAILVFLSQFKSGLVLILLAAAGMSAFTGRSGDTIAILAIVFLNAAIGFVQERRAERAIASLKAMVAQEALVVREGRVHRLAAAEVVPGDLLIINEGDRIVADARLVESRELQTDESALTGESNPVAKSPEPMPETAAMPDRRGMVWTGTIAAAGSGRAVVVETGARTVFGKIAGSLADIRRERTPFERRVDAVGRRFAAGAAALAFLIGAIGIVRGFPAFDMLLVAIAMAVAIIPEGLPAVLAVVLAIGVQRMARRRAIVRRLPAVETLGAADVICTDKTGTLTENKMTVREIALADSVVAVSGEGWTTEGEFSIEGRKILATEIPVLDALLRAVTLCNRAELQLRDGEIRVVGEPTEAALIVVAGKAGIEREILRGEYRKIDEIPFSTSRKYRAVLEEQVDLRGETSRELLVVGAFEVLADRSSKYMNDGERHEFDAEARERFAKAQTDMGRRALRVLGVAVRRMRTTSGLDDRQVSDLTMLGLVGMIDPPRPGVAKAIERCRAAGIRVAMITGDHRATAVAIAKEIGLMENGGEVYTGEDLAKLDDRGFRAAARKGAIFARVLPETKLRIVSALQDDGHVVAVTGDGVNDAPALKKASIGIAMGLSGTDVAKEAAEMILADDNFVTVVSAIEEGRIVFRNVKQTASYLFMTNMGETAAVLATLITGLPLPLLPAQILWMNLVTDCFCDVALATERGHEDVLADPPRKRNAPVITKNTWILAIMTAVLMSSGTVLLFVGALRQHGLEYARTVAFTTMAVFQLWNVLNMRSASKSLFSLGLGSNRYVLGAIAASLLLQLLIIYLPFFHPMFHLVPMAVGDWIVIAALTSSIFVAIELYKILVRHGRIPRDWI